MPRQISCGDVIPDGQAALLRPLVAAGGAFEGRVDWSRKFDCMAACWQTALHRRLSAASPRLERHWQRNTAQCAITRLHTTRSCHRRYHTLKPFEIAVGAVRTTAAVVPFTAAVDGPTVFNLHTQVGGAKCRDDVTLTYYLGGCAIHRDQVRGHEEGVGCLSWRWGWPSDLV